MTAEGRPAASRATVVGIAAAAALVPLNSTMIAVALPEIAADLDVTTRKASLLVTVYLVAMLMGQPLAGRLSDAMGNRRTVNAALVGFSACSVGAAAAGSFVVLVVVRAAQAAFASALAPSVQALLRSVTSEEDRGRAFGLMGSVLGVGAAAGPVVGGLLTEGFGWPAIFLVNVPIAGAALVVSLRLARHAVDRHPLAPATGASATPMPAEPSSVANRVFVAAFFTQALSTLAQYTLLLVAPIILTARGWSSGAIGLALSALTVGMIVMGPAGGRAGDRRGRQAPVLLGLVVATVAVAPVAIAGADFPPALLIASLGVFGFGLGFATPSVMTAALESVPRARSGAAAGILSTARYVGSITTTLALAAFATNGDAVGRPVLLLATAGMVASVAFARRLPHGAVRTVG